MKNRMKKLFLFLWRMFSPLIIYQFVVSAVVVLVIIILIGSSMAGTLIIPDGIFDELNNRLSLLLTGMGAVVAMIPLGLMYAWFRSRQEAERRLAEEREQERRRQEEMWAYMPSFGDQPPVSDAAAASSPVPTSEPDSVPVSEPVRLRLNLRQALRIVVLGFSLCICANALLLSVPVSWDSYEEVSEMLYSPPFIQQIICIGLIVPLAEELVFRGLGYARMRLMIPAVPAMIISALYFGIYHGNLVQGIYASLLGLVLAWIMETYDSLAAVYILHAAANVMSVLLSNTAFGIFLYVLTLRYGLILICGGITIFILHKIREDRLNYETSVNCNTML